MAMRSDNERHLFTRYMSSPTSSFTDLLTEHHPDVLPWSRSATRSVIDGITHGTTIVALRFTGGVLMAGDRQATSGTSVGYRYAEKVHPADDSSCIGIAGTSALAAEMARLFQV